MGEGIYNRVRLTSGLILFSYVSAHLVNLSLGLVSVPAMDAMLLVVIGFWGHWSIQAILATSLAAHVALAFRAIWRRRSLNMPWPELLQMVLGFCIPFMLALHVSKTRVAETAFHAHISYTYELLQFWVLDPAAGFEQVLLLVTAWLHACLGINFNLRLRRWYPAARPLLLLAAVIVPLLATLGFLRAGYVVSLLARDHAWVAAVRAGTGIGADAARRLLHVAFLLRAVVFGGLAAILAARWARMGVQRRRGLIGLTYPDGRKVRVLRGMSVLEASRAALVPHVSICGGRGRCSTCRIGVSGDPQRLPPASVSEAAVLERMKLPPNVRLACQLRPTCDLAVTPLLNAGTARRGLRGAALADGEREIVVMFADLRGFTSLSEHRLPYDVVFLLNRYFAAMGQAIELAGGHLDKFIGDGIMALFGIADDAGAAARQALVAAIYMSGALDRMNDSLRHEVPERLRIGIGLHAGTAVVGEMGYGSNMPLTAIGDCVNTASRLESMSKDFCAELVLSEDVERLSGLDLSAWGLHEVAVRGRVAPLRVRAIPRAAELVAAALGPEADMAGPHSEIFGSMASA